MDEYNLWIEKFRPKTFDEVKGQEKIKERLKAFVEKKNVPHILLAGPAGSGKTTLALIMVKELFKEDWQENFLELNASDERGIDAVYEISNGDGRRIANVLQSCAAISNNITEDVVYEIVSAAEPKEVKLILELAVKGDFQKSRSLLLETMLKHGLSGIDIIKQIQKEIWKMNLLKEYSPKKVSEIESNREQVSKIIEFIKNFKIQKKKALLIYGPTGTGKTSHVYTIANELNLEILELNASDFRNSDSIKSIVGSASKQQSLFFKSKIILIDEVDGISGQQDRGGLQALIEVIEESSFPIIITSNDIEIEKLSSLLRKVNLLEFKPVENKTIYKILRDICDNEKINYEETDLVEISENINGDLRAAMLDLDKFFICKKFIFKYKL